ncbi:unannotated protein [freshwater metagenome]|uniref:Unannotated protein n=1 Tax=freshwater metagenome TaxID=449393 RepID=A0A6J7FXG7_9ZZZZ|nr:hypothetical protein [Actinomycetota bacterium]
MSTQNPPLSDHQLVLHFLAAREQLTSRDTYRQVVGPLLDWHQTRRPDEPLARLSRADAIAYYREHLNPLRDGQPTRSPATIRRDLTILASLYAFFADRDLRDPDRPNPFHTAPGSQIPPPKPPAASDARNRPTLTAGQLQRTIDVARDLGPNEHFLVVLIGLMGQPVHGIQALTGHDVPPAVGGGRHLIHLRARRGTRSWEPLLPELHDTVEALRTTDPDQPLLRSPRGRPANRRLIGDYFRQITAHATVLGTPLPALDSALLHHTFVVMARQSGWSVEQIQALTGQLDGAQIAIPDAPGTSRLERLAQHIRNAAS